MKIYHLDTEKTVPSYNKRIKICGGRQRRVGVGGENGAGIRITFGDHWVEAEEMEKNCSIV